MIKTLKILMTTSCDNRNEPPAWLLSSGQGVDGFHPGWGSM